jgi:uncharacterized membrane protein
MKIQKTRKRKPSKEKNFEITRQEEFSGPLPHPQILEYYDHISPGAADRILAMAEKQALHRQELEKAIVQSDIANEKRGMNYALIITIFLYGMGAILILNNKELQGLITLVSTSAFLVYTFLGQKKKEDDKVNSKN